MTKAVRKVLSEDVQRSAPVSVFRRILSEGANEGTRTARDSEEAEDEDGYDEVVQVVETDSDDGNSPGTVRGLLGVEGFEFSARLPTLTWTHSKTSGPEETIGVELGETQARVVRELMAGLNHELAEPCRVMLRQRRKGTMRRMEEGGELPTEAEQVRRRQEHIDGLIERMPAVIGEETRVGEMGWAMIRNAIVYELQDLYRIVWSMEYRQYDVCAADVRALFSWFKLFEDALRLFVGLSGAVGRTGELQLKRSVIQAADDVRALKRRMEAADTRAGRLLPQLRTAIDELAMRVTRLLRAEAACGEDGSAMRLVSALQRARHGREATVLLSRAVSSSRSIRARWLKATLHVGAMRVARRVRRRHGAFVGAFEQAMNEYRRLFHTRAQLLDSRLHALHSPRDCHVPSHTS
ncbi:hypothetical protein BWQ96_09692 [Gracilariopsis chorda]|uniref:Uncharacterized protein n=1 Tax=Gracilariopsis chorda TaxID=448386 RepID=A0A2V3IEZ3_9FLOR|nr:hypothetical protein BWQ96_09692 [Gracilariopsis chorda]|eukprot:PXF40588.1 hypothetical protein BWQ96_09692 [Gracilariopsis chorda]